MLKISKFENIFGIKKLSGADNLNKINVIYAPNGTAKTSIADALYKISKNDNISDVYNQLPAPSYELEVDGTIYNENSDISLDVITYSGVENFELKNDIQYSDLVISISVKNQIMNAMNSINNSINKIKNAIESVFPSKKDTKIYYEALSILAKTDSNDEDLYMKIIKNFDLTTLPLPIEFGEKNFLNIATLKLKKSCEEPAVLSGATNYFAAIQNPPISNNQVFDGTFTVDNLSDLHNLAIKSNFYSNNPQRALFINNTIYNQNATKELIDTEINNVYGNHEAKEQFEKIKNALKGQKKTIDELNNNPILIPLLSNFDSLVQRSFATIIQPIINILITEKANISQQQDIIANIQSTANLYDNILFDIWEKFKSRFKFKKFDLDIKNRFNAVAGINIPKFVRYIPGTNTEITDPKLLRFSTGEIKVYNLINLILSVESKIQNTSKNFTLILDDAVDSFDYKNKYGIIDYLNEKKDESNLQMIVFTHNFDFYRSTILAFGKKNTNLNQYFVYRNINDEIIFYLANNKKYYLEMSNFNSWKNAPTKYQYFALIPFSRNVIQLEKRGEDPDLVNLDNFLHYDSSSESYKLSDIQRIIFNRMKINLPNACNGSDFYLKEIQNVTVDILNGLISVNETDLEYKLTLGIYIRIFLERFLFKTIEQNVGNVPVINDTYARTNELIKKCLPYLSQEQKNIVREANIISPSYVHANSFMYEPLIDIGSYELIDVARKIFIENQAYPF